MKKNSRILKNSMTEMKNSEKPLTSEYPNSRRTGREVGRNSDVEMEGSQEIGIRRKFKCIFSIFVKTLSL